MHLSQYKIIIKINDSAWITCNYSIIQVTVTPFLLGFLFGPKALIGFLPGAIVSGVQMAVSASNTGGAWDNAKKYVQAGLMKDNGEVVKKGT